MRTGFPLLTIATVLMLIAAPAASQSRPSKVLPGLQTGNAPWTRGLDGLSERLEAIGLPAMPAEAFVQHIHQQLTISIRGVPVVVPGMIGINQLARYISPIHTHDSTGAIHIEAATRDTFNLGQFFDVWGVRLTSQCIGGYCNRGPDSLRITVNGLPFAGDPRRVPLEDREAIAIAFGHAGGQAPASIPLRKGSPTPKREPK